MKVIFSTKSLRTDRYGKASIEASHIDQVKELEKIVIGSGHKIIGVFVDNEPLWNEWQK